MFNIENQVCITKVLWKNFNWYCKYFKTWSANGGIQCVFLYDSSSRTLKENIFVSVDFEVQTFVWKLISIKFCIRIIDKKGCTVQQCQKDDDKNFSWSEFFVILKCDVYILKRINYIFILMCYTLMWLLHNTYDTCVLCSTKIINSAWYIFTLAVSYSLVYKLINPKLWRRLRLENLNICICNYKL